MGVYTQTVDEFNASVIVRTRRVNNTCRQDADEIDDEMAAPWTAERHWRSARVRHSPPPVATPSAASPPRAPASPPVPALRAKTAHPSMSIELRHDDDDDNDEIVEEIEHIFDEFDMDCRVSSSRFREEDNDYVTPFVKSPPNLAAPDRPLFGVPVEQLKKYLNNPGEATNNNDEQDESKMTSSSPAFRRNPSEQILAAPDCLPNAVLHPDDRPVGPAGRHPRVVHSPVETRRAVYDMEFTDYDAVEADIDDMDVDNLRLPVKSRSVASFGTSPSPDENARRQRSLPTRRHDGINNGDKPTFNGVKKMAVMPSSIVNRKPTGLPSSSSSQAIAPKLAAGKQPEPLDPKTNLQISLKNINSSDWEDKIEGIKRLEELTVTNNDAVVPELHMIVLALIVEVKNLRSQVSRAAIQCMGKMFQHCGKYMEQDLDRTVPLLLNKAGDTNRFIRDDAHTALMNVTEYVSAPKAIVVIVTEGLSHKSATVRAEAAKLLASIVIKMGPAKVLSGAKDVTERILPAAAHFIQDGSLEARAQAKTIFSVLINDPVFEKAMQKYLSPNVIRNIQRTLDQLRKNIR